LLTQRSIARPSQESPREMVRRVRTVVMIVRRSWIEGAGAERSRPLQGERAASHRHEHVGPPGVHFSRGCKQGLRLPRLRDPSSNGASVDRAAGRKGQRLVRHRTLDGLHPRQTPMCQTVQPEIPLTLKRAGSGGSGRGRVNLTPSIPSRRMRSTFTAP